MHLIYINFRSMNHVTVPLRTAGLLWKCIETFILTFHTMGFCLHSQNAR